MRWKFRYDSIFIIQKLDWNFSKNTANSRSEEEWNDREEEASPRGREAIN